MGVAADLTTPRLRLRRWRPEDREPFAALNADPEVMEHFPSVLSLAESDALVDRIEAHFENHGFGPWVAEHSGVFIGFVGLAVPRFETSFTPCVEIAWRLARPSWGRGLATEGAHAALAFGFDHLGLDEIVAFTVPGNVRSRRVMEKLGMSYAQDFEHPLIPEGHPLRRHVLYRLKRDADMQSGQLCNKA
ncbi:MAG TPA: GNAT family N-acetyltransferase [Bryobacteraceae bacterium]|nr:GNAT family N-acetyltransferase [Bryobacteraceae bacterium]